MKDLLAGIQSFENFRTNTISLVMSVSMNRKEREFTAHIFFNEKMELEYRPQFLSTLLDIEHRLNSQKIDTRADAQKNN